MQSSRFSITPKSDQEMGFIKDVISNFKSLDMADIDDSEKLERLVNQLGLIVGQSWSKNAKNQGYPNTPSNGGQNRVAKPLIPTGQQEVMKIGSSSKQLSKTPSNRSSTTKFKKSQIKVEALGN